MKSVFKILQINKKNENISYVYITEKASYDEAKEWLSKAFELSSYLEGKDWAFKKAAKTNSFEKELNELEEVQQEMRSKGCEYFDNYESYVIQEVFKS